MLKKLSQHLGANYDASSNILSQQHKGYTYHLQADSSNKRFFLTFAVTNPQRSLTPEDLSQISANHKILKQVQVTPPLLRLTLAAPMTKGKFYDQFNLLLNDVISYLYQYGYQNTDQESGQVGPTHVYVQNGRPYLINEESAHHLTGQLIQDQQTHASLNENRVLGIIGALLGSLIGVMLIVFLGQLGYVSVAGGLLLGICTLKGYELFAKKLSKFGIWISLLIIVIMTFIANALDYSLFVARELDIDVFYVIQNFTALFTEQVIDVNSYLFNLGILYLFTLIGAGSMIFQALKDNRNRFDLVKLG